MTLKDPQPFGVPPKPQIVVPPGSNPAIGKTGPLVQVPPAQFAPLGPTARGAPGKGPGYALSDHQHPPQAVPPQSTAATLHRASWTHTFGDDPVGGSGTLNPGQSFTIGDGAAAGSVVVGDNPSGELHADGTYHVAVHGIYVVNVTATVRLQGSVNASDFGLADFQIVGLGSSVEAAAVRHVADSPAPLDLPMSISFTTPITAATVFSFVFENMAGAIVPLRPGGAVPGDLGNGVVAVVSVYLLGTLP